MTQVGSIWDKTQRDQGKPDRAKGHNVQLACSKCWPVNVGPIDSGKFLLQYSFQLFLPILVFHCSSFFTSFILEVDSEILHDHFLYKAKIPVISGL